MEDAGHGLAGFLGDEVYHFVFVHRDLAPLFWVIHAGFSLPTIWLSVNEVSASEEDDVSLRIRVESDTGQLATHLENNGMLVGCHSSPFKFPKNQDDAKILLFYDSRYRTMHTSTSILTDASMSICIRSFYE